MSLRGSLKLSHQIRSSQCSYSVTVIHVDCSFQLLLLFLLLFYSLLLRNVARTFYGLPTKRS